MVDIHLDLVYNFYEIVFSTKKKRVICTTEGMKKDQKVHFNLLTDELSAFTLIPENILYR